jgi:hypothetical protein
LLTVDVEDCAAGDEDAEEGAFGEQIAYKGGGRGDVLEVVQEEHHLTLAQEVAKGGTHRLAGDFFQAEGLGYGGNHEVGASYEGERHEEHAAVELGAEEGSDLQSKASLAYAWWACQRDQAQAFNREEAADALYLTFATNEACTGSGETAGERSVGATRGCVVVFLG